MKTSIRIFSIGILVMVSFCFGKSLNAFEFPELNAAKRNLLQAKTNLEKAATDFGGHKAKAMEHLDKAVKEIDEAILYGDKH